MPMIGKKITFDVANEQLGHFGLVDGLLWHVSAAYRPERPNAHACYLKKTERNSHKSK